MKRLVTKCLVLLLLMLGCTGCSTKDMSAIGMGLGILNTVSGVLGDAAQDKRLDKLEEQQKQVDKDSDVDE